jgi:CYTH domain-containing protein
MKEIEKKFLLRALPQGLKTGIKIQQGYLNANCPEIRVRQREKAFYFTLKGGEGFTREEIEARVSRKLFKALWSITKGRRIKKTRYTLFHEGLTWEIDEFHGALKGLIIAEVELPSESTEFSIPPIINHLIIADVTDDRRYSNKVLATQGLPK